MKRQTPKNSGTEVNVMSALRKSAKGQDCQVRMPGICNFDKSTTVLAHLGGGGMGMKHPDLFGAYCCSSCHEEADRVTRRIDAVTAKLWLLEGIIRTQEIMLKNGLIEIK